MTLTSVPAHTGAPIPPGSSAGGLVKAPPCESAAGNSTAVPSPAPCASPDAEIRVEPWDDPVVERIGFSPQSSYVELFWLPVLGPSALLLVRRVADLLVEHADGVAVPADELARALGLGGTAGRHAPFPRAVARCVRYGMARAQGTGCLGFRRMVAPLPLRLARRLPSHLAERHAEWERAGHRLGDGARLRHRVRLLALEAAGGAPDWRAVERHLHLLGVHPALADDAVRWVAPALPAAWPGPGGPGQSVRPAP